MGLPVTSPRETQSELHDARTVPRCNRESPVTADSPVASDDAKAWIPKNGPRVAELRCVREIEDLPVELEGIPLFESGDLGYGEIQVPKIRSHQRSGSQRAHGSKSCRDNGLGI